MSNLSNQQINSSFNGILQVPGGITSSLQQVQDGSGNGTGLFLSSTGSNVTTSDTFIASVDNLAIPNAVIRSISDGFGDFVSVKDFGAIGDGAHDDTYSIQQAITSCQTTGKSLYVPAGQYKITSTLSITSKITIKGDGARTSFFVFVTNSPSNFAISIDIPDNTSAGGISLGSFGIKCNGGSAQGSGINLSTTSTNSAITQSVFHDIYILNPSTGFKIVSVTYMSAFKNITISCDYSNSIINYGFFSNNTTYNSYSDIEVTCVGPNAYAYYMTEYASQWKNITCDGVSYFSGPYANMQGFSCEGIFASSAISSSCITLNQFQSFNDVAIINVPNSKCNIGINVTGQSTVIKNVRVPNNGAGNQPNSLFYLASGSTGQIVGAQVDYPITNKLESILSNSILNNWIFIDCFTITNTNNFVNQYNTWTPSFPGWTTAPSVITANYVKIGRQVNIYLYLNNGVCPQYSSITGLPFISDSASAGAVFGASSAATSSSINGMIVPSSTSITNIPALNQTSNYWIISGSYISSS